jgi:competence protein ComEA
MTAHSEAVARRLAQLTAELDAVRAADGIRPGTWQGPEDAPAEGPVDAGDHTRVRGAVAAPVPGSSVAPPDEGPPAVPVPGRHAARRRGRTVWTALPRVGGIDGRVSVGPGPLAVVAVVVAVGVAVTAWWLLRADGEEVAPLEVVADRSGALVPPGSPDVAGSPAATPASASPSGAAVPGGAEELVVDVAGKVRRPGIVVLSPGDRVVDALRAAGGARRGVPLTSLNLARPVVDGEQIVVGVTPPPGVAASAAAGSGAGAAPALVNLNSADQVQLESLPQVGPVTAQAIIAWRDEHGGFSSVEELLEVDGIGEATLEQVAPFVTL